MGVSPAPAWPAGRQVPKTGDDTTQSKTPLSTDVARVQQQRSHTHKNEWKPKSGACARLTHDDVHGRALRAVERRRHAAPRRRGAGPLVRVVVPVPGGVPAVPQQQRLQGGAQRRGHGLVPVVALAERPHRGVDVQLHAGRVVQEKVGFVQKR